MPEKKPVPPPAPRNRHERRKRATEQRKARKWVPRVATTAITGDWFTWKPKTFETIGPRHVRDSDGATWEFIEDVPLDETKVVVPDDDGKPELRQIVPGVPDAQVIGRIDRSETTSRPVEYQITDISLVTITPEIVAKVAEKTGRSVDAVNAYLAGPEQDATLLGAFLFHGVAPTGKLPPSRLRTYQARAVAEALNSGGIVCSPTGGFTRPTGPADPPPASFDREP